MTADRVVGLVVLVAALLLYLLPLLVAAQRDHPGLRQIVLVNVLLGWTVAGWAYCWVLLRSPSLPSAPPAGGPHLRRDPSLQDRAPTWLAELPRAQRTWRALPRDTAPLPLDTDTEQT